MRGKFVWIMGAVVIVAFAAVLFIVGRGDDGGTPEASPSPSSTTPSAPSATTQPVATDEPSVKPIPEPEPITPDPGQPSDPPAEERPSGGAADVVITYGYVDPTTAAVVVAGYVGNVVEETGTCTLKLTKGATVLEAESTGMADAGSTACGALQIDASQLTAGTWTAVLEYSSPTTSGTSDSMTIEVS